MLKFYKKWKIKKEIKVKKRIQYDILNDYMNGVIPLSTCDLLITTLQKSIDTLEEELKGL